MRRFSGRFGVPRCLKDELPARLPPGAAQKTGEPCRAGAFPHGTLRWLPTGRSKRLSAPSATLSGRAFHRAAFAPRGDFSQAPAIQPGASVGPPCPGRRHRDARQPRAWAETKPAIRRLSYFAGRPDYVTFSRKASCAHPQCQRPGLEKKRATPRPQQQSDEDDARGSPPGPGKSPGAHSRQIPCFGTEPYPALAVEWPLCTGGCVSRPCIWPGADFAGFTLALPVGRSAGCHHQRDLVPRNL